MVKQFKHVTDLWIFDFNASFCLKKASNHSKISLLIPFEKPPQNTDKEAHTAAIAPASPFYVI